MFWRIRTKFLIAYITGVALTLAAAFGVSYISFQTAYENINERSTNAEFYQISGEVDMLLSEADTLLLSRIITNSAAEVVARPQRYSLAEISYAIKDLSKEVNNLTASFQYIDSVYVYVDGEWLLGMTEYNTRRFFETEDCLSERSRSLVEKANTSAKLAGCMTDADFPLEMKEPVYFSLYRKAYYAGREIFYCMNIEESALFEKYSGYMKDGLRSIRLLDSDGIIVSSKDKGEIGTKFELLEGVNLNKAGMLNADDKVISYMPIERYDLMIVSSIPASVYVNDLTVIRNRMLMVIGLGMVVLFAFFYHWIEKKLVPVREVRLGMKAAGQGDYSRKLSVSGNDELSELTEYYNSMLTDLEKLTENRRLAEIELRERELEVLRNEINPHFLYNTLNTIKCMADLDGNDQVARCIIALGGIVAPLYKVTTPTWTLWEEMKIAEKYLEIMNIRYGNRIGYAQDVPEELMETQVMRFILQPIMENSILHGFAECGYMGQIVLTVNVQDGRLYIRIDDDGIGMTEEKLEQINLSLKQRIATGGVGMMNVNRRITLRYGAEYGLFVSVSEYGGLCTYIVLPEINFLTLQ